MADVTTVSPNQTSTNITQGTSEDSDTQPVLIGVAMAILILGIVFGKFCNRSAVSRAHRAARQKIKTESIHS